VTGATFEQLQAELEQIVGRLERGDVPVDEALELWRRGEELLRLCRERLANAEGRVEELARGGDAAGDG
jgi:exodeoxyribonuclease VII small subunit